MVIRDSSLWKRTNQAFLHQPCGKPAGLCPGEERREGRQAERMRLVLPSLLTKPAWKHPWLSSCTTGKSPCFLVTLDQLPRMPVGPAGPFWHPSLLQAFPVWTINCTITPGGQSPKETYDGIRFLPHLPRNLGKGTQAPGPLSSAGKWTNTAHIWQVRL